MLELLSQSTALRDKLELLPVEVVARRDRKDDFDGTLVELVDTLSRQAGAHALRAGVDFLYNDDTITYPRSARGAYTFSSLANFLSGTYNNKTSVSHVTAIGTVSG